MVTDCCRFAMRDYRVRLCWNRLPSEMSPLQRPDLVPDWGGVWDFGSQLSYSSLTEDRLIDDTRLFFKYFFCFLHFQHSISFHGSRASHYPNYFVHFEQIRFAHWPDYYTMTGWQTGLDWFHMCYPAASIE